MSARVEGRCPMGCGSTLFLGHGGYVTCSLNTCPNPGAASDILAERLSDHLVTLTDDTFSVKHPLRERLNDALLSCDLADYMQSLGGPPRKPGRYVVRRSGETWFFYDAAKEGV